MTGQVDEAARALRALSVRLEDATGYDSIPTIERYETTARGSYMCVFPDCGVVRRAADMMWLHLHFGRRHGLSFGKPLAALLVGEDPVRR